MLGACWGLLFYHSTSMGSPSLLASDSLALQAICECVWWNSLIAAAARPRKGMG